MSCVQPLPNRIAAVQDPVIPIVGELVAANHGTISLGQGVVHYSLPPQAAEGVAQFFANPENHKYKAVQGIPELREELTEKFHRENNIQIGADNALFVTAGANLAFANAILAIADPGDEIVILAPYYFNFEMAIVLAACVPVVVPTTDSYQPDLDRLANAITPRTKAVVTISPNNPTGAVYSESDLRAVNELCARSGIYHINDEVYEYFVYDDARHFSPASISGAAAHTITLQSLSKAYGFASWRIGCMIVPAHLEDPVKKVQDTLIVCPPVVSQWAAVSALQVGSVYAKAKISEFAQVREQLYRELAKIEEFCCVPPTSGAFYAFLRIKTSEEPLSFVRRLIEEYRVACLPGTAFGMEGCYLRISYGALQPADAIEGIHRLSEGIAGLLS